MTKLKRMHEQGRDVDFDERQPWSSVFSYCLESEDQWWNEHVVDPCRDCKYSNTTVNDYVDGDVVAGSSSSHITTGSDTMSPMPTSIVDPNSHLKRPASGGQLVPAGGGKRRRGQRGAGPGLPGPPPAHQQYRDNQQHQFARASDLSMHDGEKWILNKNGKRFCPGFQAGTCYECTSDGLHCARNPSLVHQCEHCKKTGHGRSMCWALVEPADGGKTAGKGDGKAKGKGKGKGSGKNSGKGGGAQKKLPWNKW